MHFHKVLFSERKLRTWSVRASRAAFNWTTVEFQDSFQIFSYCWILYAILQVVALDQVRVEHQAVGQDLAAAARRAQAVGPHGPGQLAHPRRDELPGQLPLSGLGGGGPHGPPLPAWAPQARAAGPATTVSEAARCAKCLEARIHLGLSHLGFRYPGRRVTVSHSKLIKRLLNII